MMFKKGDIVKGVNSDVDGLILEVKKVSREGYILKTLENKNSKFWKNRDVNEMEEHKIGGIFRRTSFWENALILFKNKEIDWKERVKN